MSVVAKVVFRLRTQLNPIGPLNTLKWRLLGAQIGQGSLLLPGTSLNWPHQVKIGAGCLLEGGIDFKFADSHKPGPSILIGERVFVGRGTEFNATGKIEVGDDCLIASGCKLIDHDHGLSRSAPLRTQPTPTLPIRLERDVWLGVNVVVLKGVTIHEGAVVAAGAVVTKDIPAYEIWGGVPARKLGERPQ